MIAVKMVSVGFFGVGAVMGLNLGAAALQAARGYACLSQTVTCTPNTRPKTCTRNFIASNFDAGSCNFLFKLHPPAFCSMQETCAGKKLAQESMTNVQLDLYCLYKILVQVSSACVTCITF